VGGLLWEARKKRARKKEKIDGYTFGGVTKREGKKGGQTSALGPRMHVVVEISKPFVEGGGRSGAEQNHRETTAIGN